IGVLGIAVRPPAIRRFQLSDRVTNPATSLEVRHMLEELVQLLLCRHRLRGLRQDLAFCYDHGFLSLSLQRMDAIARYKMKPEPVSFAEHGISCKAPHLRDLRRAEFAVNQVCELLFAFAVPKVPAHGLLLLTSIVAADDPGSPTLLRSRSTAVDSQSWRIGRTGNTNARSPMRSARGPS